MKTSGNVGARVLYCGHDATFVADLYRVGNAIAVHAAGPVNDQTLERPARDATHHLVDFPVAGMWNPRLGVFVVPANQVKKLKVKR